MYLPEINRINNYRYEINGFGGINRRETAEVGEFAEALNLSADEYPLITPRKRYDIGLFGKVALMWHNNDRDMALVPAWEYESVAVIGSQRELDDFFIGASSGDYRMVCEYGSDVVLAYAADREVTEADEKHLVPGQAYMIHYIEYDVGRDWMIGSIEEVNVTSHITYLDNSIEIPGVAAFKNPVSANIGSSTVICDEVNGVWVLEYDRGTDSYSYEPVQYKYEVSNETSGTSGNEYITGGNYCHVRCWFDDNTIIKDIEWANTEEVLYQIIERKDDAGNYVNADHLIAYGAKPYRECQWYRLRTGGNIEPVDYIHYEFCTLEGAMRFKVGDYVELKMSGIWGRTPDLSGELEDLDGFYDVVKIRENAEGVKYSLMLKGMIRSYSAMNALIMVMGRTQKEGESTFNNKFLMDGMSIERKAPKDVRFICSHNNRLWANNGNNEILCCVRGNPFVWYRYEGNSLDAWATTIGGDGSFTGCINYGYPLFFKNNRLFRITGSRPSNFGFDEYSIKGIKAGCHDSAVIVNDVLYYQGVDGIYAYSQSTPSSVSHRVKAEGWRNGKAVRFRDRYYIAVTEDDKSRLYCYDTKAGIWHEESYNGAPVRYMYPGDYMTRYEECVTVYTDYTEAVSDVNYAINRKGEKVWLGNVSDEDKAKEYYTGHVITPYSAYRYKKEKPVEWTLETTDLLAGEPEHKYLKCINVNCRVYTEEYNEIGIYISYGDGEWHHALDIAPTEGESRSTWYKYPVGNKRCENLKIRACGVGDAVIYGIILEFEKGGK